MKKIIVKVPGTTANLGPGFDSLGMALSIYNIFEFIEADKYCFDGVKEEYANDNNLIVQSAKRTYCFLNVNEIPFKVKIIENVPIARGLGSSATCIIAGIIAASRLANKFLSDKDILNLSTSIEGHPDNVAPAYLGNLISCFKNNDNVMHFRYNINNSLIFTVLIPDFELETKKSREVLPKVLDYKDVVYNMSRAINIPKALRKGSINGLFYMFQDRMHEPFRFPLIMDSEIFKEYSVNNHLPFCLSGSGPTLLYITKETIKDQLARLETKANWKVLELKCDGVGTTVEVKDEE